MKYKNTLTRCSSKHNAYSRMINKTTSMELYKNKEHNTKSYDRSVFPATIELHSTTKNNPAASKKYDYYYVKVRGKVVILSVKTGVNFI